MTIESGSIEAIDDPPEKFSVEVGDMISWREPDLSRAVVNSEWVYEEFYGIVVRINMPESQYSSHLWDVYFYGSVVSGYDPYGYEYEEREDTSWLKIMVVEPNGRKSFRYISTDDEYKILSKAKRTLKDDLTGSIIIEVNEEDE